MLAGFARLHGFGRDTFDGDREGELFGLRGFGAGGALEDDIVAMLRVGDALAVEEFGNSKDLQARIFILAIKGLVESGRGGFCAHRFGGVFEGDEDADFSLFAFR